MTKEAKALAIIGSISALLIASLTTINLLQTFVIPSADAAASVNNFDSSSTTGSTTDINSASSTEGQSIYTDHKAFAVDSSVTATTATLTNSYKNNGSGYKTIYHIVDIKLKSIADLKTYIHTDSNGKPGANITATPSKQIEEVESGSNQDVLVAINGDYCYYNAKTGYIIRNDTLTRSTVRNGEDAANNDFAIFNDSYCASYMESDIDATTLLNNGCYQNFIFGPAVISEGSICVDQNSEVTGKSANTNQRSAIGYISPLHFVFFMSEGRDSSYGRKNGFSLYEMATILKAYGCREVYNLDGGGSACLIYGGEDVYSISHDQREMSDIIYVVNS